MRKGETLLGLKVLPAHQLFAQQFVTCHVTLYRPQPRTQGLYSALAYPGYEVVPTNESTSHVTGKQSYITKVISVTRRHLIKEKTFH